MNRKIEMKYLFLIIVIFIAACIETDIYLPAFPDMMQWFSASEGAIQNLLTWNFLGICLAGPLYGPISDSLGRKKPLMLALVLFFLGSLITIFATTLQGMLVGRILQGLGSGGCFTLGTAVLFDVFQKDQAITAVNRLNMIVPVIMAGAPMLGGYLNAAFGFRANFLAIAILVLLSLILFCCFFKETLCPKKSAPFHGKKLMKDFKKVFSNLAFWQISIAISLIFSGYIAFLSGTSVLFVVEFGLSKAIFPFVQASLLIAWVAGSFLLKHFIAKRGHLAIKKLGILLCSLGALELLVCSIFAPQDPYILTSGMILYSFGANWIIGLYFPEGMELLPDIKGITASLLTSFRLLIASAIVGACSYLYNGTIYPLTFTIFGTVAILVPILLSYEKRKPQSILE
jgi:MFS transporter, DHA1 family, multidrug resistance protein